MGGIETYRHAPIVLHSVRQAESVARRAIVVAGGCGGVSSRGLLLGRGDEGEVVDRSRAPSWLPVWMESDPPGQVPSRNPDSRSPEARLVELDDRAFLRVALTRFSLTQISESPLTRMVPGFFWPEAIVLASSAAAASLGFCRRWCRCRDWRRRRSCRRPRCRWGRAGQ